MGKMIDGDELRNRIQRWYGRENISSDGMLNIIESEIMNSPSLWIPVTDRLPDKPYGCIVTVMDTNPVTFDEFKNIYPNFVGWDGEDWCDDDGYPIPFEVIAWMPLPKPYNEGEGEL